MKPQEKAHQTDLIMIAEQYSTDAVIEKIVASGRKVIIFGSAHEQKHCLRVFIEALQTNRLKANRLIIEGLPMFQPYLDILINSQSEQEKQAALEFMINETAKLGLLGEYRHIDKIVNAAIHGGITEIRFADCNWPTEDFTANKREQAIAQAFLKKSINWNTIRTPETEIPLTGRRSRLDHTELGLQKPLKIDGPAWGIMGTVHANLSTAIRFLGNDHLSAAALINTLTGGNVVASIDLIPNFRGKVFRSKFKDAYIFPAEVVLPSEFSDWPDMYTTVRISND